MKATLVSLLVTILATGISALPAELDPVDAFEGITVTPGPGLPSLESLNLTVASLAANIPNTLQIFEERYQDINQGSLLQKRKAACFPELNQFMPRRLVEYCVEYLHTQGDITCKIEHNRKVFCTTTDKDKHTIQVVGIAEATDHEKAPCKDVSWAVFNVLQDCKSTSPTGKDVVASGDEYAYRNGHFRVSVFGDTPLNAPADAPVNAPVSSPVNG